MTKPTREDLVAPLRVLKQRSLTLGSANAFDYATQFLLPVVLVRYLNPADFGQYRLLWLVVLTVMAIVPLAMPQSLYYFLPRADKEHKRLYTHQALLYLVGVGLIGGLAVSPLNPLLPLAIQPLERFGLLMPCFVMFWVATCLLDVLPTIEEKVSWQAGVTVFLTVLRTLSLAVAAYLTASLEVLIWVLLVLALLKLFLLLRYMDKSQGLGHPWLRWAAFREQLQHAAPFGISSALFTLRAQADQWVVASLFAVSSFAAFSIAAVLGPLVNLFRLSVNHAFLPSMSRLHAENDLPGMLELNSRANVMVSRMVFPMLAFAFVFAEELVTLIYTASYLEAAMVMRVYSLGLLAMVVELFSITLLLKEGVFALRLNLLLLPLSVLLSGWWAGWFGLPGAAAGSVLVLYLDRFATLQRIATRVGLPLCKLQDWGTLLLMLLLAMISSASAWTATHYFLVSDAPLLRMTVGGMVLLLTFGLLHTLLLNKRDGLLPVCDSRG